MNILLALLRRPSVALSLLFVLTVVTFAVLAPWLSPYDPSEQYIEGLSLEGAPLPPDSTYWLGTDLLGRDLFSRLVYGARTSLFIGLVANGLAVLIGTLVGLTAGFVRGWLGSVLMRFTDLMMAFPALLLAIALAAIFQPSVWIVALVIAMVNWVQIARVIYSETVALAARDFVAVERTLGASARRILFSHL
ncbi:TPA: ABC transporter permease, partial [Pseudomonas aeruginosa]|nr:ABC transporter permease [Pseudomonas aeruginosa]